MIAAPASTVRMNSTMKAQLGRVRALVGYVAIAIGVTAGGTIIGATVVAPVVSGASIPLLPTDVRDNIKHSVMLQHVPNEMWLYLGVAAAMATLAMVGWQVVARFMSTNVPAGAVSKKRTTAALPVKLAASRNASRTPRAVLALAEAGNAPADIARRTGLSLDAVSMCLSLSSFAARQ